MLDQFKDTFKEEAYELLANFEDLLLQLEEHPEDPENIAAVFRTMHTIKGSAAMFGFSKISGFTHEVESILDTVRQGHIRVSKKLIDTALLARDHIKSLLDDEDDPDLKEDGDSILETFKKIMESASSDNIVEDELTQEKEAENIENEVNPGCDILQTYRITFRPNAEIMKNGTNVLLLLRELEDLGEYSCIPRPIELPALDAIEEELCYFGWDIILTSKKCIEQIQDVFIFVENDSIIEYKIIDSIEDINDFDEEYNYKRLGEILVDRGIIKPEDLKDSVSKQHKIGQIFENAGVEKTEIESALIEQEHVRKSHAKAQKESATVRVNSEKLDTMVDLVGELVTLQARLSQVSDVIENSQVTSISEQLERLVSDLRDGTMGMRMVPIGTTFNRFRRMIRDLGNQLGKDVQLLTNGGETELDKTVIERLSDPLVHILRNSLDHGFESPDQRVKLGKNGQGTLMLSAYQAGASVCIEVEDDGRGIDGQKVFEKAVEKGVISGGADLTDHEKLELIFHPGLSTANNVTSVSGRGVGMDVVRKELESLGGSINLYSVKDEGTRVTLRIPLTLAIIEGLLVEVGENKYVFPLSVVQEVIEYTEQPVAVGAGKNQTSDTSITKGDIVNNRGEILPFVKLADFFKDDEDSSAIKQIIVANINDELLGFCVDRVIGDHQTVIKNLGRLYKGVQGVSGATILGDGSVALIVDVQRISALV